MLFVFLCVLEFDTPESDPKYCLCVSQRSFLLAQTAGLRIGRPTHICSTTIQLQSCRAKQTARADA